jgi:hypothetical protein
MTLTPLRMAMISGGLALLVPISALGETGSAPDASECHMIVEGLGKQCGSGPCYARTRLDPESLSPMPIGEPGPTSQFGEPGPISAWIENYHEQNWGCREGERVGSGGPDARGAGGCWSSGGVISGNLSIPGRTISPVGDEEPCFEYVEPIVDALNALINGKRADDAENVLVLLEEIPVLAPGAAAAEYFRDESISRRVALAKAKLYNRIDMLKDRIAQWAPLNARESYRVVLLLSPIVKEFVDWSGGDLSIDEYEQLVDHLLDAVDTIDVGLSENRFHPEPGDRDEAKAALADLVDYLISRGAVETIYHHPEAFIKVPGYPNRFHLKYCDSNCTYRGL